MSASARKAFRSARPLADLSASCMDGRADLFDLYDTAVQAIRRRACVRRSRHSHGFLPFLVRSEPSEIRCLDNISHGSVNSRSGWLEGVEDAVMRLNPASL